MNKKGQEETRRGIIDLIIAGIVLIILLTGVVAYYYYLSPQAEIKRCKLEVLKASLTTKNAGIAEQFQFAHCAPVDLETLDLSENEIDGKQELAGILTDEMINCWDKFGEGKRNPRPGEWWDRESHCYTCSTFTMPDYASYYGFEKNLDLYLSIDDKANTFLNNAFVQKNDQRVYGINAIDTEAEAEEDDGELIFEGLEPTSLDFNSGKKYYLVNIFLLNKEGGIGWTRVFALSGFRTTDTFSKMAFVAEENIPEVCKHLEN